MVLRKKYLSFFLVSITASLIVGFRGNTNDTQVYYDVFRNISNLPLTNPLQFYIDTGIEIGFGWYAYIVNAFTTSGVIMFTLFAFFNFYFIFKTAKILDINHSYPTYLYLTSSYFFLLQFMQMRQGLAVCIVIFTLTSAVKYGFKFWQLILILLSITLHQSAGFLFLFSLPFFLVKDNFLRSTNYQKVAGLLYLFALIILFKFALLDLLINFSGRLNAYAVSDTYNESIYIFSLPNIKTFLTLLVLVFFPSKTLEKDNHFQLFLFLMYTALAVRVGFSDFAIMSGRLSTAFSYVEIFALPMLLIDRLKMVNRIVFVFIICTVQLIVTLGFQAPYLFESYFEPLYQY